jgi:hypothetical protein
MIKSRRVWTVAAALTEALRDELKDFQRHVTERRQHLVDEGRESRRYRVGHKLRQLVGDVGAAVPVSW